MDIFDLWDTTYNAIMDIINRLGEYEELEAQGQLIKLPCKIGDTVYVISTQHDNYDDSPYKIVIQAHFRLDMLSSVGKTVFLTREEAQKQMVK